MNAKTTSKSAFTLVEMLVVIAIISLVAMALSSAVRGARRTANAAKCQANLKNLHAAVTTFFADNGHYPHASSYEVMGRNSKGKVFSERQGWVSWVPKGGGKRRDANGKTPWSGNGNEKSHADKFYFPANTDQNMQQAISEGSLFKYVGKDPMTYRCPQSKFTPAGSRIFLSYSMNAWFICHSYLHEDYGRWKRVKNGVSVDYARCSKDFTSKNSSDKHVYYIPSRMALFIEMEDADDSSDGDRDGQSADGKQQARVLKGDCVWEWSAVVCSDSTRELGRFNFKKRDEGHFKGASKYCNIVFVDGHVTAITDAPESIDEEWNGHPNLNEYKKDDMSKSGVFYTLGNGSY